MGDAADVGGADPTPPILRFTLSVLDAGSLRELAQVCSRDMVELFGSIRARVCDEGSTWAETEAPGASEATGPVATMSFRLSGPDEQAVRLEITVERGPDLGIVRQQFLDLMAVARRAWRTASVLSSERRRAREDALTGLDNRRALEEYLEQAFYRARHVGEPLTVMLVDLDHFKLVNDTQGHPAGDDVLQQAAETFREHLRPGDRVCRWGGDEFLLAVPGIGADVAVKVAERLRRAFQKQERARGTTMTIGVADTDCLSPDEIGVERLIALADEALYEAKRAGRNQTHQARSALPPAANDHLDPAGS